MSELRPTIDINENFTLDLKGKTPNSYTKWLEFNNDIKDPLTGTTLISSAQKERLVSGITGFYGANGRLLEKDNVSVAEKDDKFYIERRDKDGYLGLGIFDVKEGIFYTGMASFKSGEMTISPCSDLEQAKGIIIQGLIAEMRKSSRAFNSEIDKLQKIFVAGKTLHLDSSLVPDFAKVLCSASYKLKTKYFEPKEDKRQYNFNTINANLTKEMLDADLASPLFDGKEFEFFSNIGERSLALISDDSSLGLVKNFLPKVPKEYEGKELPEEIKEIYHNFILSDKDISDRAKKLDNLGYFTSDRDKKIMKDCMRTIEENLYLKSIGADVKAHGFYLRGPTGNGKTFLVRALAAMYDKKIANWTCSANTEAMDLFYKDELVDGNSVKVKSDIVRAMENGDWILLDEVNNMNLPTELDCLNTALANGIFTTPTGEVIKVHPETQIFFCGNLGQQGTQELSAALRDRCRVYNLKPLSAIELKPIAMAYLENAIKQQRVEEVSFFSKEEASSCLSALCDVISNFNDMVYGDSTTMRGFSSSMFIDTRDLKGTITASCAGFAYQNLYLDDSKSFQQVLYEKIISDRSPLYNANGGESAFEDLSRIINENPYFASVSHSSTISI